MAGQNVPTVDATQLQLVMLDSQTVDPFAGVNVADPSPNASDTAAITLSTGDAAGVLSGSGLTEMSPGNYLLVAGSPSAVQTDLDALVFTPASLDGQPSVTTAFTIEVTNNAGGATSTVIGQTVSDTGASLNDVQPEPVPGQPNLFTSTTTTTESSTFTTFATQTDTIDETTILAVLNGMDVYDQSFALPYSDPTVQAAVVQADAALAQDSATAAAPALTSSTTTNQGTLPSTAQTGQSSQQSISVSTNFGPSTYGPADISATTGAETPAGYFKLLAGQEDTNVNTDTQTITDQTDTATTTYLTTQVYTIQGTPDPVACYMRGTRVLTVRGEIAVEALQIGDLVVTVAGHGAVLKPIRWIGHRRLDLRRHPDPENTHPIRFRAGAFTQGVPHRDLVVSPNHRMRVDDTLVTAVELANSASIVQESPDEIEYWHIELDAHDVILAEGMLAETYQDVGNRSAFENGSVVELHPVLDGDVAEPCLPYAGVSAATREHLIARAEALGWTRSVDPMPWLEVDGQHVEATRHGDTCRFTLPAGSSIARLRSRSTRPWDVDPHSGDRRQLGLKLHHLALGNRRAMQSVVLDAPGLTEGFNRLEGDETGGTWRWTNGDALLPLGELAPGRSITVVEIVYDQVLPIWVAPATSRGDAVADTAGKPLALTS